MTPSSSDQPRNYLFIVRAYNDVDHFSPLLDWLLQREEYRVAVYTSNPTLCADANENLLYLKRRELPETAAKDLIIYLPPKLRKKILSEEQAALGQGLGL